MSDAKLWFRWATMITGLSSVFFGGAIRRRPAILRPKPTPDESLFEWRVCPFCRGVLDYDPSTAKMLCWECGREWVRV